MIRESFFQKLQASPAALLQQQTHVQFIKWLRGARFLPLSQRDVLYSLANNR